MRRGRWRRQAISVYTERPTLLSNMGRKAERGKILVVVKCSFKESKHHHGDNGEPL